MLNERERNLMARRDSEFQDKSRNRFPYEALSSYWLLDCFNIDNSMITPLEIAGG